MTVREAVAVCLVILVVLIAVLIMHSHGVF
jgi:hypothetical protein